jgi:hypothetical protein
MLKRTMSVVAVVLALAACSKQEESSTGPTEAAGFKHENTPDNLKQLMTEIAKAAHANETQRAAALTRSLIATRDEVKSAFQDGVAADLVDKVFAPHGQIKGMQDAQIAPLFKVDAGRSEVKVHGANTEEIAKNQEGTVVRAEFPGGAVQAAKDFLKPGITFYEVEMTAPGSDLGIKFHLFFWTGQGWRTLGPIWRSMNDAAPPAL